MPALNGRLLFGLSLPGLADAPWRFLQTKMKYFVSGAYWQRFTVPTTGVNSLGFFLLVEKHHEISGLNVWNEHFGRYHLCVLSEKPPYI